MIEVGSALESLARVRPVFHSEADFQHALAWEIRKLWPNAGVRLEVPLSGTGGRAALDIVVRSPEATIALELKYFKGKLEHAQDGEQFSLPATVARDISRYDVCKDIRRIEHAVGSGQVSEGYVVVLANDPAFWQDQVFDSIDVAFKIHHGRVLSGALAWSERAGPGTTRNRERPIELCGAYELAWWPYSDLGVKNGVFKMLIVPVFKGSAKASPREAENAQKTQGSGWRIPPPPKSPRGRRVEDGALRGVFAAETAHEFTMTFEQIEALRSPLPPSAHKFNAWWHGVDSHPQAVWELAGYKASPNLAERKVVFRRKT